MSGSGAAPWSLVEDPVHYAVKLAAALNCSLPTNMLKNHLQLVDCLRYTCTPQEDSLSHQDIIFVICISKYSNSYDIECVQE
jgi:hypothetical protein